MLTYMRTLAFTMFTHSCIQVDSKYSKTVYHKVRSVVS